MGLVRGPGIEDVSTQLEPIEERRYAPGAGSDLCRLRSLGGERTSRHPMTARVVGPGVDPAQTRRRDRDVRQSEGRCELRLQRL